MLKNAIMILVILLATITGVQAATISANPYHVALNPTETTSSTISWSGTSGTVQVYVSVNNGAEQQIYSGSGSSTSYSGIQTPNWYVFKLKQSGSQLAWTAVTTQWKPDFQFGYNTMPTHLTWFAGQNYQQAEIRSRLNQDLAMACSFNGCTIRFNVWSFIATHIDNNLVGKNKWIFDPDYTEIVNDTVDWLANWAYNNKARVVIAFHNEWFTGSGYYGGSGQMTLSEIKERTVEWMSVMINAIEANAKAKQVVFGYDYQNEVWPQTPNIVGYVQYIVDNAPVPLGKRVLSISYKQDGSNSDYITWWAGQLSPRRFDYVDLHFYPDVQSYDTPSQLSGWFDKAWAAYPNATVYMGEYGYKGGGSFPNNEGSSPLTEDNMATNMRDLATNAKNKNNPSQNKYYMAHMAWDMVPPYNNTEPAYGMCYTDDQPKDVIGTFAASGSSGAGTGNLTNADLENSGTTPPGWTGNSNISYTFSRQTGASNSATNGYYGRISINSGNTSDWVTIDSSALSITPLASVNYNVYLNAYVRTNMRFKVSIREFDAGSALIREQDWTPGLVTFPANTWKSLVHLLPINDPWIPSLHPNTRSVKIRFTGYGNGSNPSTLDIDAVSASIRAADRVVFASADFNRDGAVNITDLAMLASHWLDDSTPSYLNSLAHRYTFDGNCNDSVGTAHGTVYNNGGTFYEWGPGYLWLKNGTAQKSDLSAGGAYVDLPDYILDGMRNNDGITIEMFFTTTESHWWSGYITFGAGNPADGTDDALSVTSRENNSTIALWHQEAGYWGHRVYGTPSLDNGYHFALVIDNANNKVLYYLDGALNNQATKPSHEMPGLKATDNAFHDTMNYIGRYYTTGDPMVNAKIHALNLYSHALTAAEVAQSYASGTDRLCTKVDGDLNDDCRVDMEDFAIFAQQWLQ